MSSLVESFLGVKKTTSTSAVDLQSLVALGLSPVPLSNAGNPILLDEEVEVKYVDGVTLIEQGTSKQAGNVLLPSGLVVLTNLRVIFITAPISETLTRSSSTVKSSGGRVGWGFDLCHVAKVEDCNSSFVDYDVCEREVY